jgi:ubiquinone/menaquinone biosynthesis C-methylase UbiE
MIYQGFARVYDQLMTDTPYDVWYKHLLSVLNRYNIKGKDVLELACGTGEMTRRLAKDGFKVIGTDLSGEMLEIAQEKAFEQNLKLRFVQQDMTEIELFQKYDAIISFCDGFNYLIDKTDLEKSFRSCYDYLNEDAYLIFDISSAYKLEHVLGQTVYTETSEEVAFIWENYYDAETKILEFDLTIFEKEDNRYIRHDEIHKQRAYSIEEIKQAMNNTGFECLEVLDTNTNKVITDQSERLLFIGRKINE